MPIIVVLDACVLYPLPLRDTLLRIAEYDVYAMRWSRRILDEVARNLIEDRRATPEQAKHLIRALQREFRDAEIPEAAIAAVEPAMTNHPADRHVLAAAVASKGTKTIVTSNLRHFPSSACEPFGIDVVHADEFLCELHERAPDPVYAALEEQAAALSRPPMTVTEVLDRLEESAPEFVTRVREPIGRR